MGIMKNKIFLFPLFLTLILSLTSTSTLTYADTVGFFSKVEGRVDILKEGDTKAIPVKVNDNVSMGDIVRTKSDGKAEITFKDDTTVRLAPETRMKIDEYVFNPDNSRKTGALGLFRGKVRAVVSKTKGGIIPVGISTSSFNINTPTAIAGVKGTDFFVFYDKGMTGVIFKEGSGFVANPNMPDKIVNINAGQITFIKIDTPPLPPRPASNIEMAQHSKDTTPAEKPKEKKEEGQKPKEEKSQIKEAKAETKGDKEESSEEEKLGDGKSEIKKETSEGDDSKNEGETTHRYTSRGAPPGEKASETAGEPVTLTYSPLTEASPRDEKMGSGQAQVNSSGFTTDIGFTPADIGVIPDIVSTINTIPDTTILLPVTETQPQTLKNTDVTVNVKFQ